MSKMVIFYSRAGENYFSGAIRSVTTGNTEIIANKIAKLTGAALFKIEQVEPYSNVYSECIEQAKEDQRNKVRVAIASLPDLNGVDTVYLGFPNYWGTMPMAVFTLLESCDFSGVKIFPFCTNEGSGMGRSESDIKKYCPKASVQKGLSIPGYLAERSDAELKNWVEK